MTNQRQDLLHVLREAYALAQNVERLLRQFSDRHAGHAELIDPVKSCLAQTLEQQELLAACVRRIDGAGQISHSTSVDADTFSQATAEQPAHDLAHVRTLVLREIDLYASGIETAESSGFFETRLVCEAILLQKSSMAAWLSEHASA